MRIFVFVLIIFCFSPLVVSAQDMNIYQKAEQMIILGFRGNTLETSDISSILTQGNWGGVIFFDYDTPTKTYSRNITARVDLKKFITSIQSQSKIPLFISLDEEGGKVSRLKSFPLFKSTYSALELGMFSTKRIQDIVFWRAKQIRQFGFNMNFAPVVDICYRGTVMYKQKRCFSTSDKEVMRISTLVSNALQTHNIVPVYKHYPGIGTGKADTHNGFVDITKTHTQKDRDIFTSMCAKTQYPTVMVSHIVDTSVDTLPASLSKKHIENLRAKNCKYALIISDDMDMKAITDTYTLSEVLEKSINADINMLIFSNNMTSYNSQKAQEIKNTLKSLIDSGKISHAQVERSYGKIIEYKKAFGLCDSNTEIDFCH